MLPKKAIGAVVVGVVLMGVAWFLLQGRNSSLDTVDKIEREISPETVSLETAVDSQGEVEVAVTPKNIRKDALIWEFEVVMDTHSVELDDDMVVASELVANGAAYQPISWEGDPPGGHHRAGVLKFRAIALPSGSIALVIRDVGGVATRNFQWSLE